MAVWQAPNNTQSPTDQADYSIFNLIAGNSLYLKERADTVDSSIDQTVTTTSDVTFNSVNTGHGANELYPMNQGMLTTNNVTHNSVNTDNFNMKVKKVTGTIGLIPGLGSTTGAYLQNADFLIGKLCSVSLIIEDTPTTFEPGSKGFSPPDYQDWQLNSNLSPTMFYWRDDQNVGKPYRMTIFYEA